LDQINDARETLIAIEQNEVSASTESERSMENTNNNLQGLENISISA
jgi:hypothetical protein